MASGGARNRSGPQKDEHSLRGADRAGLRVLPTEQFNQEHPQFPLPGALSREVQLWDETWKSPQAWAWINDPWRWHTIAMWVRRAVAAESEDAKATDVQAMIRLADQIGLTPAGLKENGWTIGSASKPAANRDGQSGREAATDRKSSKNRFLVIDGDGDAA